VSKRQVRSVEEKFDEHGTIERYITSMSIAGVLGSGVGMLLDSCLELTLLSA
jgi:hypothetical protein